MDQTEILHLRSYSKPDGENAVAAFQQLKVSDQEADLMSMVLLRDIYLDNDLCILIQWRGEALRRGRSPLGLRLASAFAEFGLIDHTVWAHEGRCTSKERETVHEKCR
jgi:hypothetical protein